MAHDRQHLAAVIGEKTLATSDVAQLAHEVAGYLLAEHHTADLDSLLRDVMQYRTAHGVVDALVTTAHDITPTVRDDIEMVIRQEIPKAKTVHLQIQQDPALVGGLRITLADEQLDLSVRAKLNTFKRLTAL